MLKRLSFFMLRTASPPSPPPLPRQRHLSAMVEHSGGETTSAPGTAERRGTESGGGIESGRRIESGRGIESGKRDRKWKRER